MTNWPVNPLNKLNYFMMQFSLSKHRPAASSKQGQNNKVIPGRGFPSICRLLVIAVAILLTAGTQLSAQRQHTVRLNHERLRPQLHFTPRAHWMNDPNGLVYINGTYHLFYQYYPKAIHWGPMHWGHAKSQDLIHWQHLPIALYPDSLGYIFSGSAVYDKDNTSGLGSKAHPPLVAIFTHHDPKKADSGKIDVEKQSIAYSLDQGKTWNKYGGNPVVQNPGVRDFRDPKVFWYAPSKKWVMVVAAGDQVRLYDSKNLIDWRAVSAFGKNKGSHQSVWECPDLFALQTGHTTKWVLTLSEGNGGPNTGSGIQYFIGDFDGQKFTSDQTAPRWLEYGPDDYAGNTWNGVRGKRLYIGWMTNLMYAGSVPATTWRGALTLPRRLGLTKINGKYYLMQRPVKALDKQIDHQIGVQKVRRAGASSIRLTEQSKGKPLMLKLSQKNKATSFTLIFSSAAGDSLRIGLDLTKNHYYINRGSAGDMAFARGMPALLFAPRVKDDSRRHGAALQLIVDRNSVELFADNGLSVMTALYFPKGYFDQITLLQKEMDGQNKITPNKNKSKGKNKTVLKVYALKSIWP